MNKLQMSNSHTNIRKKMEQIKIDSDKFAWLIIDKETAEFIFENEMKAIYVLYNDESEGMVESVEEIREAEGLLGIELGFVRK